MLKSILSTLVAFTLVFAPVTSHAGEEKSSESVSGQEIVTTLEIGQPAPFTGTLFSTSAAASLLAELELNKESCDLKINREVDLKTAEMQLQIDNLNATILRLETNHNSILLIKNNQIDYLDGQLERAAKPNRELWFALGVVGGVILTGTAAWSLGQINQQ